MSGSLAKRARSATAPRIASATVCKYALDPNPIAWRGDELLAPNMDTASSNMRPPADGAAVDRAHERRALFHAVRREIGGLQSASCGLCRDRDLLCDVTHVKRLG